MPLRVTDIFYQVVVVSVLLYGDETWVLPPLALKALEAFHMEATRRPTGMRPLNVKGGRVAPTLLMF